MTNLFETDHQLFIDHMQKFAPGPTKFGKIVGEIDDMTQWDYIDLIVKICERLITIVHSNKILQQIHHSVRARACEYLKRFLSPLPIKRSKEIACDLGKSVVHFLKYCIDNKDDVMQVQLLSLLRVMMVLSHAEIRHEDAHQSQRKNMLGGGTTKTQTRTLSESTRDIDNSDNANSLGSPRDQVGSPQSKEITPSLEKLKKSTTFSLKDKTPSSRQQGMGLSCIHIYSYV